MNNSFANRVEKFSNDRRKNREDMKSVQGKGRKLNKTKRGQKNEWEDLQD